VILFSLSFAVAAPALHSSTKMDRKRNSGLVYSTNDAPKSAIFRYDIKWDDVIEEVSQTTELSYYEKNAADDFVRRVNKLTAGLVSLDCVCDILDDLEKIDRTPVVLRQAGILLSFLIKGHKYLDTGKRINIDKDPVDKNVINRIKNPEKVHQAGYTGFSRDDLYCHARDTAV